MNIEQNKDITSLTTFGIPVKARWFAEYESEKDLLKLTRTEEYLNSNHLHIGGGSNLLFLKDYDGMILHSKILGIKRYDKNPNESFVIAGAAVKWTDLIEWCLNENLAGLENLANIPGEVGASAIQNVGAYGVEAKDVIYSVECFDSHTRKVVTFNNEDCQFDYRDSAFKNEWRGRYFVLRVAFKVTPNGEPQSLEYGPLKDLAERLGHTPSIREVADEITTIRNSKLPDPQIIGSAGSFFKNPVVRARYLQEMETMCGEKIPSYPVDEKYVKLSAAWLIDHAGLKTASVGGAALYEKQPLVIINKNNASADDVKRLADLIEREVRRKYYVSLKPEVNYIDNTINVTILGSGTSKGIPEVRCLCNVCTSTDPKDKRLRASALIEQNGVKILIDPSPDFRQQALVNDIHEIDAILVTHYHYDHVGGIDDLRPFCSQRALPMYVREDVDADLRKRWNYCFRSKLYPGVPSFDMHIVDNQPFFIKGIKVTPIEVMHGQLPIYGYRIGNFAYVTDAKTIDDTELDKLRGLDLLILNALRQREHFAHFSIPEALQIIEEIKPKETYLTHFCHEIGKHQSIQAQLPDNVHPAYDGLHLEA